MASRQSDLRYGETARSERLAVLGCGGLLGLLIGMLVWVWSGGHFSGPGAIGGTLLGLLFVVAWSLRDGLLRGEPRVALARRIALAFLVAGLALAAVLWGAGPATAWTGLLTAGTIFAAWLLFVVRSTASANREVLRPLSTMRTDHGGRALVVYHSAQGGLMRAMQEAFAMGLQAHGWQVDLSTASRLSPVDLAGYHLLVLGTPCYNRGLARPVAAYLDRLGDLHGVPVVLVVTGFNFTERAMARLRERVQQAHGNIADEIELWTAPPAA